MKIYLNKLNKRIDILVDAWKKAENMMSKMGDYKVLMDQVKERKEAAQNAEAKDAYNLGEENKDGDSPDGKKKNDPNNLLTN